MSKHFVVLPYLHSKASTFQQSVVHPFAFHINTQEPHICFSQNISPLQEAFSLFCCALRHVGFPGKEADEVPVTRNTQSLIPDSGPWSGDNRQPYTLHDKTSGLKLRTSSDALYQESKCGVFFQVRAEEVNVIFLRTGHNRLKNGHFIRNDKASKFVRCLKFTPADISEWYPAHSENHSARPRSSPSLVLLATERTEVLLLPLFNTDVFKMCPTMSLIHTRALISP